MGRCCARELAAAARATRGDGPKFGPTAQFTEFFVFFFIQKLLLMLFDYFLHSYNASLCIFLSKDNYIQRIVKFLYSFWKIELKVY
jgi:hypothetical protein